jgi:phosphopentomutase
LAIGQVVREEVTVPRVIALGGKEITLDHLVRAVEEKENTYIGINCPKSGVYNEGYLAIHLGFGVNGKVQVPTILGEQGVSILLLGKVADIVENPYGENISCVDTTEVMQLTLDQVRRKEKALIITNVQETDLAGHGENVQKYAEKLKIADQYIGEIIKELEEEDLLVIMADHGNDPTIGHSRHTREEVPLLIYGPKVRPGYIGKRTTLADVGATIAEYFQSKAPEYGQSFLKELELDTGTMGQEPHYKEEAV